MEFETNVSILHFQKEVDVNYIKFYITFICEHESNPNYTQEYFASLGPWRRVVVHEAANFQSKQHHSWSVGSNMISVNADHSITFGEYFSNTVVVAALIDELEKMYMNPLHTVGTTRLNYLLLLLESLAKFWD